MSGQLKLIFLEPGTDPGMGERGNKERGKEKKEEKEGKGESKKPM